MPDLSTLFLQVSAKSDTGWKNQLPEGYGMVEIKKYYVSRVTVLLYPQGGKYFYQGAFSTNTTPNWQGFVKYTGTSVTV